MDFYACLPKDYKASVQQTLAETSQQKISKLKTLFYYNYLLTYDSYVPVYNRFPREEWITRASGGEGALDTPGPLNGSSEARSIWAQECPGPPPPHLPK